MSFFDRLPSDLQIWIIHSWLLTDQGISLVRTLSALDVACCKRRLRPALLELFEHIPPFLDKPAAYLGYHIKDVAEYMHWVASRRLAVKSLFLPDFQI